MQGIESAIRELSSGLLATPSLRPGCVQSLLQPLAVSGDMCLLQLSYARHTHHPGIGPARISMPRNQYATVNVELKLVHAGDWSQKPCQFACSERQPAGHNVSAYVSRGPGAMHSLHPVMCFTPCCCSRLLPMLAIKQNGLHLELLAFSY